MIIADGNKKENSLQRRYRDFRETCRAKKTRFHCRTYLKNKNRIEGEEP